jgi:hypothetical protein
MIDGRCIGLDAGRARQTYPHCGIVLYVSPSLNIPFVLEQSGPTV